MSKMHNKGDVVKWKWGNATASGTVEKVCYDKTEIQSKGTSISRNGTSDNPAIVITQDDGTKILKLDSELI